MLSPHLSRLRAAIVLVVAVFVWSDAALASFLCPHMSGCEHGMPAKAHSQGVAQEAAAGTMPCCPLEPGPSMACDISAMECCAWHHNGSDLSAVLFASDHPWPKRIVAALP